MGQRNVEGRSYFLNFVKVVYLMVCVTFIVNIVNAVLIRWCVFLLILCWILWNSAQNPHVFKRKVGFYFALTIQTRFIHRAVLTS